MQEQHQTAAPVGNGQKNLALKSLFIALISGALMIPMVMIMVLIEERTELQRSVETEIADSWGKEQLLQAPVLCIPFQQAEKNADNKLVYTNHVRFLAPEELKLNGQIQSDIRKRGIFETVVFTSENNLSGTFNLDALPSDPAIFYAFDKATLLTGLTDPTAITQKINTIWNNGEQKSFPGIPHNGYASTGFHVNVPLSETQSVYTFQQQFTTRGTTAMRYMPSGKNSSLNVSSNWPSPSFVGRNLPQSSTINSAGFAASWNANEYTRPFADTWIDDEYHFNPENGNLGVKLIKTADQYQKNTRSAKYAFLVISLSFMVFFFFEMLSKVQIHPIQYLMVGLSLAIFYVLLLSLTEHIGFNRAYWISAIAVITLIVVYAWTTLKKIKHIVMLTSLFTMLYGYIFILLQLEDYALLAGAIGLFVILASVMMLSRKVNWYQIA